MQRGNSSAQTRRQHLLQFGERAHGGFFNAAYAAVGGRSQTDGYCDCFIVIEQQRREVRSGTKLVAAAGARGGIHRIAQAAQLVDVAPQGAGGDFEALGELGSRPVAAGLEQGQQAEQAG